MHMSLEHLIITDSKKDIKDHQGQVKRTQEST